MTDTVYRDIEEDSNEESDEYNALWEDKYYEDLDEDDTFCSGRVVDVDEN